MESCPAIFRDLDDHEATHGLYEPVPSLSEGESLDLAGIRDANLGATTEPFWSATR